MDGIPREKPLMLVTGLSGLIGSRIIDAFSGSYQIVGLDVKTPERQVAEVHWITCDLTDDGSMRQALTTVREKHGDRLASVIHLAAYYDFSGEPSSLYQTLTVDGTRRLLRELQKFQAEQFIFSSSLLVMKPAEQGEVITESSPTAGEWDYPRSKLEAEKAMQEERGGLPSVVLGIAGVYDEDRYSIPIAQHIRRIYERQFESYFFPGDPGKEHRSVLAIDVSAPPWSYNPSSWKERIRICILASVGFLIASYMGLYQWRMIGDVWDPIFGEQTRLVLDSEVSEQMRRWFRLPDAVMGALAYLGDVIFGLAGSTRRWQFRPWLAILFGLDVIPLGIVSAVLVVMQGTIVGNWCFLCLVTAMISLTLVYLAYDEVWSCVLYLHRVWQKTRSLRTLWGAFWGQASSAAAEAGLSGERGG